MRISRGLFQTGDGTKINADVNGAFDIMRKIFPTTQLGKEREVVVLKWQIMYIF